MHATNNQQISYYSETKPNPVRFLAMSTKISIKSISKWRSLHATSEFIGHYSFPTVDSFELSFVGHFKGLGRSSSSSSRQGQQRMTEFNEGVTRSREVMRDQTKVGTSSLTTCPPRLISTVTNQQTNIKQTSNNQTSNNQPSNNQTSNKHQTNIKQSNKQTSNKQTSNKQTSNKQAHKKSRGGVIRGRTRSRRPGWSVLLLLFVLLII